MTSIPTSPAQQGIWINERLAPLGSVHHMPFAVHFDGVLDEEALAGACADLAVRHPALSMAVREEDGVPVLIPVTAPRLTVRQLSPGRMPSALAELTAVPFDLTVGPPARFTLLRTDETHATLLVVVHHIVFDGTSTDVFLRDLAACYAQRTNADPAPTPGVTGAAGGGAEAAVAPSALAAATAHWADRPLPDGTVLIPGLGAELAEGVGPGAAVAFDVHPHLRAELIVTAEKLGVTFFELLLAAVHTLLLRYGNERPAVAVDLGTRSPQDADRIGLYVNELPVVTSPDAQQPFGEFARAVRTELRAGYPHRAVPLARAVRGLRPGVALAPVSFTYRRRIAPVEFIGVNTTIDWVLFPGTARGALRVHLVDGPDRLGVLLMYRTGLLAPERAERIGAHLRRLLTSIAAAPGTGLADLPMLDETESAPVHGPAPAADAIGATLPSLLLGAGGSHPERTAVQLGEVSLSYAELLAAATELAHRLAAVGVTRGTVVAVCAERSPEMLAAVLAVTLAGGVYLPVDPGYPAERVALVLADAGAPVALAQRRTAGLVAGHGRTLLLDDLFHTVRTDRAVVTDAAPLPPVTPDDLAYLSATRGRSPRSRARVDCWSSRQTSATKDSAVRTALAGSEK